MIYNKVDFLGSTLMDISSDTVSPSTLKSGITAHDAGGNPIVGEFVGYIPSGTYSISQNGTYDVTEYASAAVDISVDSLTSGTLVLSSSGSSVNVVSYSYVTTSGLVAPVGVLSISSTGLYSVTEYASVAVNIDIGITPTGTVSISQNGTFDVTEYAAVAIDIAVDTLTYGTLIISESGSSFNVTSYSYVSTSGLVKPSGTLVISTIGTFNVSSYRSVMTFSLVRPNGTYTISKSGTFVISSYYSVSTSGLYKPAGTLNISSNGTYGVSEYASVAISVQTGITPAGTLSISQNGTFDVTEYASVAISVQTGITPAGTLSISENGTYNISEYAYAAVSVPTSKLVNMLLIAPYSTVLRHNYFDNGKYIYQSTNTCKTLWWAVESGISYRFFVGVSRGTRFRAGFFTDEVSETNVTVQGSVIVNTNNPGANYSVAFTPPSDGYVGMTVDNAGNYDVTVYCMRLDLFTGIEDSSIFGS